MPVNTSSAWRCPQHLRSGGLERHLPKPCNLPLISSFSVLSVVVPPDKVMEFPLEGSCTSPENPESWVVPERNKTLLQAQVMGALTLSTILVPACTLELPSCRHRTDASRRSSRRPGC